MPKVTSVTALNAKQYQVTFNTPISSSTVVAADGTLVDGILTIKLAGNAVALTVDNNVATLSADGKTLTATLSAAQAFNGTYEFKLLKDKVQSTAGQKITPDYVQALIVDDKTAPTVTEVAASAKTSTNVVTVTFSEPIQITGASAYVNGKVATIQAGTTMDKVVLTSADPLVPGTTYSVSLLNFKDYNNSFMASNPFATTVTVAGDAVAPVVQNVAVIRDNLIEVTFDKAIDAATLGNGVVKILDGNGASQGAVVGSAIKANTDKKVVTVTLGSAVPFNASNVFTGTIVLPNTIKDTSGNTLNATSQPITITKDTTAPTIASTSYITPGDSYQGATYNNGGIVVKFSEQITKVAAVNCDFKLIAPNGVVDTAKLDLVFANVVVVNNSTELVIPGTAALTTGDYTLIMGNNVVQDQSTQTNKNVAATTTVSVGAGSDTTKPVIAAINAGAATAATDQVTGTTIAVGITDNVGLDLTTVRNTTNYLIDGTALPAGSYVTIAHNGASTDAAATNVTATVTIPAQSITKDTTTAVLNVNNIKDKAGNYADPVASAALTLNDDVSPVLSTGTLATSGTLALKFSETLAATPALATDLQFTVNDTTVALASNANIATIAPGAGSDLNKYVVTFKGRVDAGVDLDPATTADNRLFLDVDNSTTYTAGDILIQTGTTTAVGAVAVVDSNLFGSLKVIVPNGSTITDNATLLNPIKEGTITVK